MDKTNSIVGMVGILCLGLGMGLTAGRLAYQSDQETFFTNGFKEGLSRSVTAAMRADVRNRDFALELMAIADSIENPSSAIGYNYPSAPRTGQRVVTPNGDGRDYGTPDTGSYWMDSLYQEDSKK